MQGVFFNHSYSHHGFDDPLVNEVVPRDDRHPEPEAPPLVALGHEVKLVASGLALLKVRSAKPN